MWWNDNRIKKLKSKLKKQEKELSKNKLENYNLGRYIDTLEADFKKKTVLFDPVKHKRDFFDTPYYSRQWTLFWNRFRAMLVNMELRNGKHIFFLISPKTDTFTYEDGLYYIDKDVMYEQMSSSINCFDYHQDISVPVKRNIPAEAIMKAVSKNNPKDDIELALNPYNLKRYQKSEFIQKIMQGAEMEKIFKTLISLGMATVIIVIINFLVSLYSSGALDNLKGG